MFSKTQWLIIISLSTLVLGSIVYLSVNKSKNPKSKLKNKNPKRILIAGDSQSVIKNDDGKNITFTYPNILIKNFPNIKFDVLASVGKNSAWLLNNLPNQLKKQNYDRIYIYIGGNDTSNSSIKLETTLSNIQKMVDLGNKNGADVFVNLGYRVEG